MPQIERVQYCHSQVGVQTGFLELTCRSPVLGGGVPPHITIPHTQNYYCACHQTYSDICWTVNLTSSCLLRALGGQPYILGVPGRSCQLTSPASIHYEWDSSRQCVHQCLWWLWTGVSCCVGTVSICSKEGGREKGRERERVRRGRKKESGRKKKRGKDENIWRSEGRRGGRTSFG